MTFAFVQRRPGPFRGRTLRVAAIAIGGLALAGPALPAGAAAESPLPAFSYRLSLPGLSTDSAPSPVPGAVVTRHVSQVVDGSLVVSGEVHNGTAQAITAVVVSATANGATRTSTALADQIAPGGDALFQVVLSGITDPGAVVTTSIVSYSVAATPAIFGRLDVVLSGARALQVTVTDPATGRTTVSESPTLLVLPGTLTNSGSVPVSQITVVIGFYDDAGNVRLVASTTTISVLFGDPGNRTLQPGQTGTFEAPISRAAYLSIPGALRAVAFVSARPAGGDGNRPGLLLDV